MCYTVAIWQKLCQNLERRIPIRVTTRKIVIVGLLIALEVVLSRFLSIQTPILRIGLGFLPLAATGILFGPVWGGVAGGIADVIGAVLFPTGAFFFGFTLNNILSGVTFGAFLHKPKNLILSAVAATIIVNLAINLGLGTYWLQMLTGKGFWGMLPARLTKSLLMIPVQVVGILSLNLLLKRIRPQVEA